MSELLHVIEEWLLNYGVLGLIIVTFADSSFSPIIPEIVFIPLALANPDKVWIYAFYTTVASCLGALLGWFIGKKLGRPVLLRFIKEETIRKAESYFDKYGPVAILIAGFTPVPYKIFTVLSGVTNIRIRTLMFWSVIGRGGRFFLEAAIIAALGAKAKPFIEQNLTLLTLIGGAVIIAAYVIYLLLRKKKAAM